jgi:hypothetical protein
VRTVALACALLGCGRAHFDVLGDGGATITPDVLPASGIRIQASGVFNNAGELRRQLAAATGRTKMTFATWFKTADLGNMIFSAGAAVDQQTYFAAAYVYHPSSGSPELVQQEVPTHYGATADYGAAPYPYANQWSHIVCAIDVTQPAEADRVRWWVNGDEQPVSPGNIVAYPQNMLLYFGAAVDHTFGNKFTGGYDWPGSLAETYVIWDQALDASAFVAQTQAGLQSIMYTGPVTPESLYFDYVVPGQNLLPGQPDWTNTGVASSTTDLPY